MKRLDDVQDMVRVHARSSGYVITSGEGLNLANYVQRRMAGFLPWEDLTRTDDTMTTTASTATYDWLAEPVRFLDVTYIGIQDGEEGNEYKRVVPVRSEREWEQFGRMQPDLPQVYRLYGDETLAAFNKKIEFRPAPKYGSKTIRRIGVMEPDDLYDGAFTPWRVAYYDDIYELLVAAVLLAKRGEQARSAQLMQMAAEQIQANLGREIAPAELQSRLAA